MPTRLNSLGGFSFFNIIPFNLRLHPPNLAYMVLQSKKALPPIVLEGEMVTVLSGSQI
jgi:hypothetical protein